MYRFAWKNVHRGWADSKVVDGNTFFHTFSHLAIKLLKVEKVVSRFYLFSDFLEKVLSAKDFLLSHFIDCASDFLILK